jgi:pyruvate formate lyase activating enzyme
MPARTIGWVDDKPVFDRAACSACEKPCVAACPAPAVIAYGERKSVEDVLNVVEQDGLFYGRSGGGITLSGGEPLAQPAFALALLREARRRRLNTAMESCGHVPWEVLRDAATNLNTILFDIKSLDSERHKEFTGVSTDLITANFRRLIDAFPDLPIHVRTPVVPGFNDTPDDVGAIAEFVSGCRNVTYELLHYHRLGTRKYAFLNRDTAMGNVSLPAETFQRLNEIAVEVFADPMITNA